VSCVDHLHLDRNAYTPIGLAVIGMKVPNADRAIIAVDKLTGYLLNVSHKRGGPKARVLLSVGCRSDNPQSLESALRAQHLSLDVTRTHDNAYGVVYEIEGPIKTPNGSRFCSVWQVDTGTDVPRAIHYYVPEVGHAFRHVRRRDTDPRRH
jgi:hypothetical protein